MNKKQKYIEEENIENGAGKYFLLYKRKKTFCLQPFQEKAQRSYIVCSNLVAFFLFISRQTCAADLTIKEIKAINPF